MSASLIGWIVSIFFFVLLIVGFFIGFWRGAKRSTVNLAISLVGVVIAFFITPFITNLILKIQIPVNGQNVSLQNLILQFVTSNAEISSLIEQNPNIKTFLLNLPQAIVNVLMFILVTIVVESLLYVVYKVLACTAFKLKEDEKKHKVLGGAIGAIKMFSIVLLAFMPLASLIGVANTCLKTYDYGINESAQVVVTQEGGENKKDGLISSLLPDVAVNVVDGLENNLLTKLSGLLGLDDKMFDYYGSFNVGEETIVAREEIINAYNMADLINQLSKVNSNYNIQDFDYEKIISQIDNFSKSQLFKNVLADTVGELIINYENYDFISDLKFVQDNSEIVNSISKGLEDYVESGGAVYQYFADDINKLAVIAKTYGENGTIDNIVALENLNAENVIKLLVSDVNYQATQSNLESIFKMNLVRDSADEIVKKLANKLSSDIDAIGVTTANWQDADWNKLANSIASVAKRYSNITAKVDLMAVLEDSTLLLDENKEYDIAGILSELGMLIDEARGITLLQTSENKPIIDKLLSKYNIPLPNEEGVIEEVIENDGTNKTIKTHKDLFDFISPSLVKIRDEKIYSIINSSDTTNSKITALAGIVSKEGNETILSDIIMPLYQVEPTKTLIVQELKNGLQSDLINLSTLSGYNDWKTDLNYLSIMLKTLNSKKIGQDSYLTLILNGNLNNVMDNLNADEIDEIIKPVFYAKSTTEVKNNILTKLELEFKTLTNSDTLAISSTGITFVEGAEEDQTQEFCDVFKTLIPLQENLDSVGGDIKSADKTLVGQVLETIKANAYRVELDEKTEEGIFKDAFISLMNRLKTEYSTEVALLEANPEILESELGVETLAEENYSKIDYNKLLSLLAQLEN